MFGVLLASIGAFFEELSSSIGKEEVRRKQESMYAMGFLNAVVAALFFVVLIIFFRKGGLTFDAWPTFILRALLSMSLAYFSINALVKAERSTYGFIRTATIPLLLVADVLIGSRISGYQTLGMAFICLGLLFLFMNHGFSKRGIGHAVMSAANAAVVIGLYKYDITHGNSVELEQLLGLLVLLAFLYAMSRYYSREHPFSLLKKPLVLLQSGSIGIATVIDSFAYLFAPASVILAATRSSTVVFTVLSGGVFFHEKHIAVKVVSLVAFVGGIILLAVG